MFACINHIFKTQGIRGFYQGFCPSFLLYSIICHKSLRDAILNVEPPLLEEAEYASEDEEEEDADAKDDWIYTLIYSFLKRLYSDKYS